MKQTFRCHTISSGYAAGEALLSRDPVLFYQTDFTTGVFREPGHDLEGKCIAGKIIIFPGGKGSSVVQADGMYKLDTAGLEVFHVSYGMQASSPQPWPPGR